MVPSDSSGSIRKECEELHALLAAKRCGREKMTHNDTTGNKISGRLQLTYEALRRKMER